MALVPSSMSDETLSKQYIDFEECPNISVAFQAIRLGRNFTLSLENTTGIFHSKVLSVAVVWQDTESEESFGHVSEEDEKKDDTDPDSPRSHVTSKADSNPCSFQKRGPR